MDRRPVACAACTHDREIHESLVDGARGVCLYGCGCEGFKWPRKKTARGLIVGDPERSPSVAVALAAIERARAALHEAEIALRRSPGTMRVVPAMAARRPSDRVPLPAGDGGTHGGLKPGHRLVLTQIAQHPNGVTRPQLTVLTGYRRSSRDTYVKALRKLGAIVDHEDRLRATREGITLLGPSYRPLPTGPALVAHWRERLTGGELVFLDAVLRAWPGSMSRDELTTLTGYKRSSRDTYLKKLLARELVRECSDGSITLATELVEERRDA